MKGITGEGLKILLVIIPAVILLIIILAIVFNLFPFLTNWACSTCCSVADIFGTLVRIITMFMHDLHNDCELLGNCTCTQFGAGTVS